ncbi:hypothetical protein EDC52_102127 [Biostraticola tofi]|uniref:Uncharacterized protein n=1 Tax=Biostraticola tofi TaxID=466109 RepID=A0A4R3Z171_9GAMM|nr:hypothetical protein EDC52_102127 [Biostraticola tofi]
MSGRAVIPLLIYVIVHEDNRALCPCAEPKFSKIL